MDDLVIDSSRYSADELQPVLQESCPGQNKVRILNVSNHRFALSGFSGDTEFDLYGDPGNCFANLLDGPQVRVHGDCEDDICDSMQSGRVSIDGSVGDVACQAMQGGNVYVRGDAGNRTGMQMREFREKKPALVIGGTTGDFLGEYMAGGTIVTLNLDEEDEPVGYNTGSGMIGGSIYIRGKVNPERIGLNPESWEITTYLSRRHIGDPKFEHCRSVLEKHKVVPIQILRELLPPSEVERILQLFYEPVPELKIEARKLGDEELQGIVGGYIREFSSIFSVNSGTLLNSEFTVISVGAQTD